MPTQVAPDLLVPYLTAAAYQAMSGDGLSERSRWAIRSASTQLIQQRDAKVSARDNGARGAATLVAAAEDESHHLAERVLSVDSRGVPNEDLSSTEATRQLDEVISDLDRLDDRVEQEAAARRLRMRFEVISEALLESTADLREAGEASDVRA